MDRPQPDHTPAEVYINPEEADTPFQYAVTQKEDDFSRLIAIGTLATEALLLAGVVTKSEYDEAPQGLLFDLALSMKKSRGVQERIRHYYLLHRNSMDITIQRIEQEMASIAFVDYANLYTPTGEPYRNPHDVPRHVRAAIKEWWFDRDGNLKFKMHDKLQATKMLADLGGHFNSAHEAAAPKVTINLGGDYSPASSPLTVDITPLPTPLPDCLA